MSSGGLVVRPLVDADRPWLRMALAALWGLPVVTVDGVHDDPEGLDGLVADLDGDPIGAATHEVTDAGWQVVTLHATRPGAGTGTALLEAEVALATASGAARLWLVTMDDDPGVLAFYERLGLEQVAVHQDFDRTVRRWKPDLPRTFRDAIELARTLP